MTIEEKERVLDAVSNELAVVRFAVDALLQGPYCDGMENDGKGVLYGACDALQSIEDRIRALLLG